MVRSGSDCYQNMTVVAARVGQMTVRHSVTGAAELLPAPTLALPPTFNHDMFEFSSIVHP